MTNLLCSAKIQPRAHKIRRCHSFQTMAKYNCVVFYNPWPPSNPVVCDLLIPVGHMGQDQQGIDLGPELFQTGIVSEY